MYFLLLYFCYFKEVCKRRNKRIYQFSTKSYLRDTFVLSLL
ncbi:hypothetical protein ACQ27_gp310 [Klebsiella phage K64-1]|nr:hypothetical protein ACQ27_gp310 [Klebsiella phage K64-1]